MNFYDEKKENLDFVAKSKITPFSTQKALIKRMPSLLLNYIAAGVVLLILILGLPLINTNDGTIIKNTKGIHRSYDTTSTYRIGLYDDLRVAIVGGIIILIIVGLTILLILRNKWNVGVVDYMGLVGSGIPALSLLVAYFVIQVNNKESATYGNVFISTGSSRGITFWYFLLFVACLMFTVLYYVNLSIRRKEDTL